MKIINTTEENMWR